MYFASRVQAGRMLAARLVEKYRHENCAILALNDGGVMVGAQIAKDLHCVITLLLSSEINLPREPLSVAGITASGDFTYNSQYSPGEIEELTGEYRNYIEQQKVTQMHEINQLLGYGVTINRDLLEGHNIILVADGLADSFKLDLTYQFLKPIAYKKLIVAVPFADVKAVDRMHVLFDEIYCLDVLEEVSDVNHYYDSHDVPSHQVIVETIQNIVLHWR